MNREVALKAVKENVKTENLIKHMLATEAIMRALAWRFKENEDEWGIAGLLHDIDIDLTNADMKIHGKPELKWPESLAPATLSVMPF